MSSPYEIPKENTKVLVVLDDNTRINTSIFLDPTSPGAPRSSNFIQYFNNDSIQYIPALVDNQYFFILNKRHILYVQRKDQDAAPVNEHANTHFDNIKFFFNKINITAGIHLYLPEHQRRLVDALNQPGAFLECVQFDQQTVINKAKLVKIQQL